MNQARSRRVAETQRNQNSLNYFPCFPCISWLTLGATMIAISAHVDGATLAVRAQPGARKNVVLGEQAGALKIAVTAPPEDGRANEALVEMLRDWLGVKRSQVSLLSGDKNRNKVFLIHGVTVEALTTRIVAKLV